LIDPADLARLVESFPTLNDGMARKSQELVLRLLEQTPRPYSRKQFEPGHITCTGLILHPDRDSFLLVHHHRLDRWLLPGGHVEAEDAQPWDTAIREVREETGASIVSDVLPLAGIDVHGIPARKQEPYHLHHDLIFATRALTAEASPTEEVRAVAWCEAGSHQASSLPESILLSFSRALALVPKARA